jgi:hypothetical protein
MFFSDKEEDYGPKEKTSGLAIDGFRATARCPPVMG